MGSCCSILNDTKHDVWVTHGVSWPVIQASVGTVIPLLTGGIDVGCALAGGATTSTGLTATQWNVARLVTGISFAALQGGLRIGAEVEKLQKPKEFVLIKPGDKYTWSGTLSLAMTVSVMNDKRQTQDRVCFTGPAVDSENVYLISRDFTNLNV